MTPEGKVKAEIKKWLKDQGAYFFMPVQTGYGAATLDFLVCLNGRFIAIECKSEKGKLTARQAIIIEQIKDAGGLAFVAYSVIDVAARLACEDIILYQF